MVPKNTNEGHKVSIPVRCWRSHKQYEEHLPPGQHSSENEALKKFLKKQDSWEYRGRTN